MEFQNIYLRLAGSTGVLLLEGGGKLIVEKLLIREDADLAFHSLIAIELNRASTIAIELNRASTIAIELNRASTLTKGEETE